MGYYSIYNFVYTFTSGISMVASQGRIMVMLLQLLISLGVFIVFFILQGIGLYTMAKRRNIKRKFLAFIPGANIYYMGKLAGTSNFFGQKVKHMAVFAMIAEIITVLLSAGVIFAEFYLQINVGNPTHYETMSGAPYWDVITPGTAKTMSVLYDVGSTMLLIIQLVSAILMLTLLSGLYKKYAPRQYFLLGFLTIMFPARYIIIFVLRNRKAIDFEAYMKARRDAYIRQQQQYQQQYQQRYGNNNPYGNPYGNPYSDPTPPKSAMEDPFEEFSSGEKGNDTSQTNSDDFFN